MANKINFNEDDLDDDFGAGSSDEEYTEREKYLVKKYKAGKKKPKEDSDEEVLGFGSSDDDDDDQENDAEEEDSDKERFENDSDIASDREDGIPDAKAWGKTKNSFYNTNYVDQDYGTLSLREEESALMEETEARSIQLQLAKQLKEADFSLDVFTSKKAAKEDSGSPSKSEVSKVKTDLTGLTDKQKHQLLKKDSPEFHGLVEELNATLEESYNELEPIMVELKDKIPGIESHSLYQFIKLKNQIHCTYAMNITFYLNLKASQKPIKNHPILKRLVQMKELKERLDEKYEEHIRPEIERALEALQDGIEVTVPSKEPVKSKSVAKPKKKLNIVQKMEEQPEESGLFGDGDSEGDDDDDEEGRKIERQMAALLEKVKAQEGDEMDEDGEEEQEDELAEMDEESKRKITYQMAKNKGLTPHRKKEQRNPRVKHREKFRKALIRRKGAVRTVRTETTRYSGEHSGIKSTVRKGIKIK